MMPFEYNVAILRAAPDSWQQTVSAPDDGDRVVGMGRVHFCNDLVDMPFTVVQWTETVLHEAHIYFCLLEGDMRGAQNALRFKRALQSEQLPVEKLRYVMNRAPKFTDLSGKSRVKRMAESLDISIDVLLPDGGKPILQAGDHGMPLASSCAKNPLRKEIAKLALQIHELQGSSVQAA